MEINWLIYNQEFNKNWQAIINCKRPAIEGPINNILFEDHYIRKKLTLM